MITLGDIDLDQDMEWPDQFTAWRIGQDIQTSVEGALIVHEAARQAGRPITLKSGSRNGARGTEYWGVVNFEVLEALHESVNEGGTYTLTIPKDGGTHEFVVMWDQSDPLTAEPADIVLPPKEGDWYSVTLRFIVVS
jgi:hypothetical protein